MQALAYFTGFCFHLQQAVTVELERYVVLKLIQLISEAISTHPLVLLGHLTRLFFATGGWVLCSYAVKLGHMSGNLSL